MIKYNRRVIQWGKLFMERYIFIVSVSLIFASAIKCLVDSENKKEFLFRRSCCSSCQKELRGSDLIPIFSYLFKKGRCSYCNQKIPLDVFLYEIFTFITIVLFIIFQNHFIFISYLEVSIFIILIFLGIEDIKSFEVNDELFYLLIILNFSSIYMHYYLFNFLDFICLIVIFHILYIFTRGGLGYGDIKVFCVLALNLNLFEGVYLLIFTFLYAGFYAIVLIILKKVKRKTKLPLVPFIALSYLTIILIREGLLW